LISGLLVVTCAGLVVGFGAESDIAVGDRIGGLRGLLEVNWIMAVFVVALAACNFDETAVCIRK
jgi:hypothetical protein